MVNNTILPQVSEGMQVQSADGKVLGKVTGVSTHDTETYLEGTPRVSLAVRLGLVHLHASSLYLPGSAVTGVSGNRVLLSMSSKLAKEENLRPNWFVGPKTTNLRSW